MPNGSLTPLGRQLRSVLATLNRHQAAPLPTPFFSTHGYHAAAQVDTNSDGGAQGGPQEEDFPFVHRKGNGLSRLSHVRKEGPLRRLDRLGEALNKSGARSSAACPRPGKLDISLANPRSKTWRKSATKDDEGIGSAGRGTSIRKILSRCIEHNGTKSTPFTLPSSDATFLIKKGYVLSDVQVWAAALLAPDSLEAATILDNHISQRGWQAVPVVVRLYLLRRPYIKPAALRLIIQQTQVYLYARHKGRMAPAAGAQMLFIAFMRLLRHAREVWPQAIQALTEMFLDLLSNMGRIDPAVPMAEKTFMLNQAMNLISRSSAVQPLKDVVHIETAVFNVLRYMAEHDPPIVLTRSGYRAVVRIQLSEKKNVMERQWAELKALSWPPWKVDRTSKDSNITPEQGLSRAGHTLARMREAGYAPQAWEKAATIYAGWDLDGTPSIQTRISAELDSHNASDEMIWVARIKATRTAQEAWAAYLALEDMNQAPSAVVHLAIFERLYAEEKRQRVSHAKPKWVGLTGDQQRVQILPGDSTEIAPPPPSSHLHTYTRTAPPTVLEFFELLEARGIVISHACLAFIVGNAASLQLGFRYLQYGQRAHQGIWTLLSSTEREGSTGMPTVVLTAIIELLCRYSGISLHKVITGTDFLWLESLGKASLDSKALNPYHTVICAMEVLRLWTPRFRPAYNAVLRALCRDPMHASVRRLVVASEREEPLDQEEQELENNRGLLTMYRLVGRTLSLMDAVGIEPEALGVYYLCCAVENVAIASWKVMKYKHKQDCIDKNLQTESKKPAIVSEVQAFLHRGTPLYRVKYEFNELVGQEVNGRSEQISAADGKASLPRLLTVPHPWLLHAYVRAIGWMGDHDALVVTMKWMIEHRSELATQMAEDRNAGPMMKKVFVAFRAFLERRWLSESARQSTAAGSEYQEASSRALRFVRKFERAASPCTISEMRELMEGVDDWPGWPTDEEVDLYCQDGRFLDIRQLYE